jgi:LCP family protein required for cell wall assembly
VSATAPTLRSPDARSPQTMTRRGWFLVVLGLLIPGSAQVLAGNRRLGRFGLGATLVFWILAILVILIGLLAPGWLVEIATHPVGLVALIALLVFYGVLWLILGLDTLRLVRLVRVSPRARPAIAAVAVLGLLGSVGGVGFVATRAVSVFDILGIFDGAVLAEPIDGRYNILLLGGDAGADRLGLRPDSITVASIDAATGATVLVGVPRNLEFVPFAAGSPLWSVFPNGYDCGLECLISYLYTYGEEHPELYPDAEAGGSSPGIEAMRDAVEGVVGLELQYTVLIDMSGFVALIDALGGVDITVEERLPIGGDVDAQGRLIGVNAWVEAGPQHMDGTTALWFARSRHSTNDYDRMRRQRVLQEAILTQFDPTNVILRFQDVAAAGARTVSTDIPQRMLGRFSELALLAREQETVRVELAPPAIDTAAPDFELIRRMVADATAAQTPSPSAP